MGDTTKCWTITPLRFVRKHFNIGMLFMMYSAAVSILCLCSRNDFSCSNLTAHFIAKKALKMHGKSMGDRPIPASSALLYLYYYISIVFCIFYLAAAVDPYLLTFL